MAVVLCLGVVLAQGSLATGSQVVDSKRDYRCGGKRYYAPTAEISKAVARHNAAGKVEHVVSFLKPPTRDDHVVLNLRVPGARADSSLTYTHYVYPGGGVYDIEGNRLGRATGGRRGQGKRLVISFSARLLGNPPSYRWQVNARQIGDCAGGDYAPNGKRFAFHGLTKPSTSPRPKALTLPATNRNVIFRAVCPTAERCVAKVRIKAGSEILAAGGYSVPGGKTRRVRLALTSAGRSKLSRLGRVSAKATITDVRTGKNKSLPVVLRRR